MSETTEAPVYSGRVLTEYPTGSDLAGIYLHTDDAGLTTLRIETGSGPVRTMLVLNKEQARALKRCMHNGIERWE